jgi:DNA-binding GntR family transcriptional regulator
VVIELARATDATVPGDESPFPSSERVYQGLRHKILYGTLGPGSRLTEVQVAKDFNVSRTPVREAVRRLTAEGLLTVDPVRGMIVSQLDADELDEILVIRESLEGLATRLATERVAVVDIAKLDLMIDLMRESARTGQWDALSASNTKFHDLIHTTAGNTRLRLTLRNLMDFSRRFSVQAFSSPERCQIVIEEHDQIARALEARDAAAADELARAHITGARQFLTERLLRDPMSGVQ